MRYPRRGRGLGDNSNGGYVPMWNTPSSTTPTTPTVYPQYAWNTSTGQNNVPIGGNWNISITNAPPNTSVLFVGGQNYANLSGQLGTTDANGNFSYSYTLQSGDVGVWSFNFYVAGFNGTSVIFTVYAPTTAAVPTEASQLLAVTPASVFAQVTTSPTVTQSTIVTSNANATNPITSSSSGGSKVAGFTFNTPENPMQVGDTWTASITGAQANAPVVVVGGMNGVLGNNQVGTTDANGNFALSGTCTSDEVGSWTEQWMVGGDLVGSISFSIVTGTTTQSTATATTTGAAASTSVNAASGAGVAVTTSTTTVDPISDFMTGVQALFAPSSWGAVVESGDFVQIAGLVAIPAIAMVMFMSHKGRR